MSRYLCVLDFEATCWPNEDRPTQEIIEFPSVLYEITPSGEAIHKSTFERYVKPTIEPILSSFCTELTGITQDKVDSADVIEKVYSEHYQWLQLHVPSNASIHIITCGNWDLKTMLPKEIKNKGLIYYPIYQNYINIKYEFEKVYKIKAYGMTDMLTYCGLPLIGRHHSGIDDTKNIANIMKHMLQHGWKQWKPIKIKFK